MSLPDQQPVAAPAIPSRQLAEVTCPVGHQVGLSDGRSIWPTHARITTTTPLRCAEPSCDRPQVWHAPPRRRSHRS